jgi:oxygen-independent coproporphyrinogen-3 oxidase
MTGTRNSTTFAETASHPNEVNEDLRADRDTLAYVHFPYCLRKCPYCDFTSYKAEPSTIPHARYADAVIRELDGMAERLRGRRLATVFFGGGTPSLWEPEELGRVLAAIRAAFASESPDLEVTAECNPTSLDEGRAARLLRVGVNRLSIGVQSLDDARLQFLGRLHDAAGGPTAIASAQRAGFERVSGDLIFGVEGGKQQSAEDAQREVARVADTGVGHLSAYGLTIEPNTQFGALARRGKLPIAPDERLADSFLAVEAELSARGFEHYETSNYARPGQQARHNVGYWRGLDYVGLGCGAVGTLSGTDGNAVRTKNTTDPERYLERALAGQDTVGSTEVLDPETRMRERIMLGLRLAEGIDLEEEARRLGVDALPRERARSLEALVRRRMVEVDGARVRVAVGARLFADGVAAELF